MTVCRAESKLNSMFHNITVDCPGELDTEILAYRLGSLAWSGLDIALSGPLGAGKTVFARGLARGLDIDENITSPSYPIILEYAGRLTLFHMDWYRLGSVDEVVETGAAALLGESGVCLVEWPQRGWELFSEQTIQIEIAVLHNGHRSISLGSNSLVTWQRLAMKDD